MQNLLDELKDVLSADGRLVVDGQLVKNKIVELGLKLDADLLELLLSNERLKDHFFRQVKDIYVFDKQEFQRFVSNKQFLPDSYTTFKNKIGLTGGRDYISDAKEVVLSWPYKDCILEGGQTKEDSKRHEIFWNETLAPDQIDRLLDAKTLTAFKKYDENGANDADNLSIDSNLVVKGNNLLSLHSLQKVYEGKIKLIYIDPPFNTGSDSFNYNDRFNHSTWLTFMKDRLLAAKKLLKNDGAIFIHLDDNEIAYLKVLCDEIFGVNNYCNTIVFETTGEFGYKSTSDSLFKQAHFLLFYAKDKANFELKDVSIEKEYDTNYRYIFEDINKPIANWEWRNIKYEVAESLGYNSAKNAKKDLGKERFDAEIANYAVDNARRVFRTASVTGGAYKKRKETITKSRKNKDKIFRHPNDDMDYLFLKGERILFYKERLTQIDGEMLPGTLITDIWKDIPVEGIASEGKVDFKRGKKPEKLLKRIIELVTDEGDIVLDSFAGSGTTGAVAHKMNRQYILCEQMDYVEQVTKKRLEKVVAGEQGGVSKEVNWQGGGSFTCLELMQFNEQFIAQIEDAESKEDLLQVWNKMKQNAFLSFQVNPSDIDDQAENFKALSLEDQKRLLVEVLDKNQLYVNYSEIENRDYEINNSDKKLNHQFYNLKNN